MMLFSQIKKRLIAFRDDKRGSEATEMVATTAMLVVFIMVGIMFLSYVMELSLINTATKKVVRGIEITGIANQSVMEDNFDHFVGNNPQLLDKEVRISNVTYVSGNKIQLKQTFRVTGSCIYRVTLINPGGFTGYSIDMPISSTVSGMSEVYWPTSSTP